MCPRQVHSEGTQARQAVFCPGGKPLAATLLKLTVALHVHIRYQSL
ncbi:MAG: hypothetical protein ABFS56_05035 [Pseudomonadota bacterium]